MDFGSGADDLWTGCSDKSLVGCLCCCGGQQHQLGHLRFGGNEFRLRVHALNKRSTRQGTEGCDVEAAEKCQLSVISTGGLFDEFKYGEASGKPLLQRCRSDACSCSGNWITVYGFPQKEHDSVLHFFFSLARVCDKRLSGGNWFHLAYANGVDCARAQRIAEQPLWSNTRVGVHRWNARLLPNVENQNICDGGLWLSSRAHQHWGRHIIDPARRYRTV